MKVILLNGAPYCGKDTLAKQLLRLIDNSEFMTFKTPLYLRMSEKFNLPLETVIEICTGKPKELPHPLLNGKIPRQELIYISEQEIKPKYGSGGVAELAANAILDTEDYGPKVFIFPDSGFDAEKNTLKTILSHFGLSNLYVIRIEREGCTFDAVKDSRKYLDNPDLIIENNVDESHLEEADRGHHMVEQFMHWYGHI